MSGVSLRMLKMNKHKQVKRLAFWTENMQMEVLSGDKSAACSVQSFGRLGMPPVRKGASGAGHHVEFS